MLENPEMDLWTYSSSFESVHLPWHLFEFCAWYILMPSLRFVLMLKHPSKGLQEWQYYEAAIKLSCMKFLFSFTLGHFLLLNSSPAAEASGRCEYHLTSPVLPGSDRYCFLQVALYEAGPAVGNLTLLIKPVSGSAVHSALLNGRRRDGRRSANTLTYFNLLLVNLWFM